MPIEARDGSKLNENRVELESEVSNGQEDTFGSQAVVQALRMMAQQMAKEADDIELRLCCSISQDILQIHDTLSESQADLELALAVDEVFSQGDLLLRG